MDLRTGILKPPEVADYCTKITALAPKANVTPELWMSVLMTSMGGDADMVAYLKRLFGYSLTGVTNEEIFSFFHGPGQNGKTKIIEAVAGAMGDYAVNTPMETFLTSQHGRHPTELADLQGARFVTAVETDEGRVWDAARIKAITGGDTIKARFMRQDFFSFKPQFKVLVHGNARPKFRTRDFAMRRRLHMVPFDVIIPEEQRDRYLADKLRLEWPGNLAMDDSRLHRVAEDRARPAAARARGIRCLLRGAGHIRPLARGVCGGRCQQQGQTFDLVQLLGQLV